MHIDIFHDTVCPWCRIGKANLKQTIAQWDGEPITVSFHAFFLNPDMPLAGLPYRQHLEEKFAGRITLEEAFEAPRRAGAATGTTFNFEAIETSPNTLLSHRMITLVDDHLREAVIDAIYKAFFDEGKNIGDVDILLDIAGNVGANVEQLRAQLASNAATDEVLLEVQVAQQRGITGVPFFIINQKYAFSGAQPPDSIIEVLKQVETLSAEEG